MTAIEIIEEEVQRMADAASVELLPLLYERFMSRNGLSACLRHDILEPKCNLMQFKLTVKIIGEEVTERLWLLFRASPCTCWIEKPLRPNE